MYVVLQLAYNDFNCVLVTHSTIISYVCIVLTAVKNSYCNTTTGLEVAIIERSGREGRS